MQSTLSKMSIIFEWNSSEFNKWLDACNWAVETPFILQYSSPDELILDGGCGQGRYVVWLAERGYKVVGLEYNNGALQCAHKRVNNLSLVGGDVAALPFHNNIFGTYISLGVVEHFVQGPNAALREMHRVLKPGGYALVSVPCYSLIRQMLFPIRSIKANFKDRLFRWVLGQSRIHVTKSQLPMPYAIRPGLPGFFEYFFQKGELEAEMQAVGFKIVEVAPIALPDGIYHELKPFFATVEPSTVRVRLTKLGRVLATLLSPISFAHNHMLLCVGRK